MRLWASVALSLGSFKFKIFMLETFLHLGNDRGMSLLIDHMAGWTRLTLNRPEQRNALNTALLSALADTLDQCAADANCRAVLVTGAGGNFAAGADIGEIEHKTSAEAAVDPRLPMWARIRAFPKPLVAGIDGFALGGGFELALMADIIVLGANAQVGLPETNLGLIPGAGGGQRLMALIGRARALRMVLQGEVIPAETAFDWGIAAYLAQGPAAELAEKIVARLALRAPLALAAAKAAFIASEARMLDLPFERAAFEALLDSADKAEGIAAFKARRKPEFTGK